MNANGGRVEGLEKGWVWKWYEGRGIILVIRNLFVAEFVGRRSGKTTNHAGKRVQ
jgi:hypothetical protein